MNRPSSALIESEAEHLLLDKAAAECRLQGATLTPIRRLVFMLLQRHPHGVKAYELLDEIRMLKSNAAPPTVYRALSFLISRGLAHKLNCRNLFIACNHHPHKPSEAGLFLICPRCHSVTEFHDDDTSQALHKALVTAGYRPNCSMMEIGAVCPSCTRKESPQGKRQPNGGQRTRGAVMTSTTS